LAAVARLADRQIRGVLQLNVHGGSDDINTTLRSMGTSRASALRCPQKGSRGGEDVALQTRQVMANVGTALAAVGATMADLVSVLVLLVDGTDVGNAYGEAAVALGDNPEPPLVTAAIVPGLGVPGALVEVSAIAAVSGDCRARAGREDQGRQLADRRFRHRRLTGQGGLGLPHLDGGERPRERRVDVGEKFYTVTHGDTHRLGQGVIVVTCWHLENAGNRGVERPAATRPASRCEAFSVPRHASIVRPLARGNGFPGHPVPPDHTE
jgi:enamine deaminase RidA (YjgF/YER057c/UK114 family)